MLSFCVRHKLNTELFLAALKEQLQGIVLEI